MDYFRILGLEKEPFSNSPEPGLVWPSHSHVECLQMLEMAIRLRRGLNVVLGEVGTGKTTLSRKLIQQFSTAEDRDNIQVHLILDPSFSMPDEFLSALAVFLGVPLTEALLTERQFKEVIKARLFTAGIDEGKIVVLLIDEGQKLPDFCIEILREILNYETNASKLLQIVIFAQTEFEQILHRRANFSDRINLIYRLNPLNFVETGRMIRFRIAQSSGREGTPLRFTWPAMYAVYRATGGYPRAINMLCHHAVLAMIIQNRTRVGWPLVRASTGRLALNRTAPRGLKTVLAAVLLALSLTALALSVSKAALTGAPNETAAPKAVNTSALSQKETVKQPTVLRAPAPIDSKPVATVSSEAMPSSKTSAPSPVLAKAVQPEAARSKEMSSMLGQLPQDKEKSAWLNFKDIYASSDADLFTLFVRANPPVDASNGSGAVANIPAIPMLSNSTIMKKSCCIRIARSESLGEAYKLFKTFSQEGPTVMLLPYRSSREGMVFVLILKEHFLDRTTAAEAMERLPLPMRKNADIIEGWDEDTVFYRGFGDET